MCRQLIGLTLNRHTLINYDRLVNADAGAVQNRMVHLFDRLQLRRDKERNILALACAFILMCRALKVTPQDAFTASQNLMVDPLRPEGIRHGFAAMELHLRDDYVDSPKEWA